MKSPKPTLPVGTAPAWWIDATGKVPFTSFQNPTARSTAMFRMKK